MSRWTHIFGTIRVVPLGRTQAEKTYILQTVIEHLPAVTGSEEDMAVYVNQEKGYDSSSSVDEFGYKTNNLRDSCGRRSQSNGLMLTQDRYILTVSGDLRDRDFERSFREFINWLCRLSKRVVVYKVLVEIYDEYDKFVHICEDCSREENCTFHQMFEWPSWSRFGCTSNNWCEYLMWKENFDEE